MNEMDQNEPSKGTEMNRNVPTRAQLPKISQNRENLVTEMIQMDQNQSLKWIKMEQNIPTRVQFTKFNQNRKNPVTQIEPKWNKMNHKNGWK